MQIVVRRDAHGCQPYHARRPWGKEKYTLLHHCQAFRAVGVVDDANHAINAQSVALAQLDHLNSQAKRFSLIFPAAIVKKNLTTGRHLYYLDDITTAGTPEMRPSTPAVKSTARRLMHGAMEDAEVEMHKRQLARDLDLLIGKFRALGLAHDGMTMFTQAAAKMMASTLPPNDNG